MKKKSILALAFAIFGLTSCSINYSAGTYTYKDKERYTAYTEEFVVNTNEHDLDTLSINWISGEILITSGDNFTIKESNIGRKNYLPLYYSAYNSTMDIEYCESGTENSKANSVQKKLEIVIPSQIKNIKINNVEATYNFSNLSLDTLEINDVSSKGFIEVNSVKTFKCNSVSSKLDFKLLNASKVELIKIDSVSGNSNLHLDSTRGYELNFNSLTGVLTKEFQEGSNEALDKYNIDVHTISGNLQIHKKK